jgi:hypothetical protein
MRKLIVGFLAILMIAACESGPEGPGDLAGTVRSTGTALGAVVVEVVGAGIEDFQGAGGTKAFWARQENPNAYRVVIVGDGTSDLTFSVAVRDRGARVPRAQVVSAVDTENRLLPVTGDFRVRISR